MIDYSIDDDKQIMAMELLQRAAPKCEVSIGIADRGSQVLVVNGPHWAYFSVALVINRHRPENLLFADMQTRDELMHYRLI